MNKTVILTTVFPAIRPFLSEFFNSLKEQSLRNFDLLILNNGLDDLQLITSGHKKLSCIEHKVTGTPSENRRAGIEEVIRRGYEIVIFADADDYFDAERVKVTTELLKKWDVVVNELVLVDTNRRILNDGVISKRFAEGQKIETSDVLEKNIFGFTNTAALVPCFKEIIYPTEVKRIILLYKTKLPLK